MKIILQRNSLIGTLLERLRILKPIVITITPLNRNRPETAIKSNSERFRTHLRFDNEAADDKLFAAIFSVDEIKRSPAEFEPFGLSEVVTKSEPKANSASTKTQSIKLSKAEQKALGWGFMAILLYYIVHDEDESTN